jgi:alpha-1,2-mannosyltransferase
LGSNHPMMDNLHASQRESADSENPAKARPCSKIARVSNRRLLAFMLLNAIGINLVLVLAGALLVQSFKQSSALRGVAASLLFHQADDSLKPMLFAVKSFESSPQTPIYQSIFFDQHIKFIYPLISLLPVWALDRLGLSYKQLYWVSNSVCWLSTLATIWFCVRIATQLAQRGAQVPQDRRNRIYLAVAIAGGGLFFYPLIRANWLGQAQAVITLLFTLAFYAWLEGNEVLSGIAIGLTVMIKPQYGLLLFWTLIRKKYSAFYSGTICVALGILASIAVFGWHQNLGYFSVLRFLSRHGESFAANQSMNGLLNRLLMNGSNLQWSLTDYPPYRPAVYCGTLISSALLLALALFLPWSQVRKGSAADLACFSLAVTMSSPVAWEHHYAILLPILIWLWFADYGFRNDGRLTLVFAVLWIVTADYLSPTESIASVPGLNVLQSTLYFAAWAILILLIRSRARDDIDAGQFNVFPGNSQLTSES